LGRFYRRLKDIALAALALLAVTVAVLAASGRIAFTDPDALPGYLVEPPAIPGLRAVEGSEMVAMGYEELGRLFVSRGGGLSVANNGTISTARILIDGIVAPRWDAVSDRPSYYAPGELSFPAMVGSRSLVVNVNALEHTHFVYGDGDFVGIYSSGRERVLTNSSGQAYEPTVAYVAVRVWHKDGTPVAAALASDGTLFVRFPVY